MRIAMVAPLVEAVPPRQYGGTERVVSVLTEELVRRGHQVTLFASGDSETKAKLVACSQQSLRLNGDDRLLHASVLLELAEVYEKAKDFDLVHSHVDWLAFPFARLFGIPTVSTTHGRLDLAAVRKTYDCFPEQALVSISRDQRNYLPDANWLATVYNGIALEHYHFREQPGDYLVFLGRISPEKRPDRAIEIAGRAGMRLIIAAKVDPADRDYYEDKIAPLIRLSPWAEYVGEVNEPVKDELLGHAYAYLFPIDWPEPFGLTMVEAMATGTPVVACRAGSVPEVVQDGVTGFICNTVTDMVDAVGKVGSLRRTDCRAYVEQRFSGHAMADGYEEVYARLASHDTSATDRLLLSRKHAHSPHGAQSPASPELVSQRHYARPPKRRLIRGVAS